MQLKVENDGDLVPAILQLEYLANTDGKLKQTCATQCLKDLASDDLSTIEQSCIAQCNRKLSVFY